MTNPRIESAAELREWLARNYWQQLYAEQFDHITAKADEIYAKRFPEPVSGEVGSELAMVACPEDDLPMVHGRRCYIMPDDEHAGKFHVAASTLSGKFLHRWGVWGPYRTRLKFDTEADAIAFLKGKG